MAAVQGTIARRRKYTREIRFDSPIAEAMGHTPRELPQSNARGSQTERSLRR